LASEANTTPLPGFRPGYDACKARLGHSHSEARSIDSESDGLRAPLPIVAASSGALTGLSSARDAREGTVAEAGAYKRH
jgi:hypothetical protein